ncbi:hypothetical protein EMIHUDRAFT_117814 [Emiliania huxleyi CCMP1516]|uniref:Anaphase-promoting complex subunit 4 WD40 domain-containing protein n=2 Tax=Emiliania huxleyi TaxID=2903 RepID=A0A0D3J8K2_EMIH1|nr:hypothetical protein EMIHUDRAFT_117814 [Emiliania huxleyi CCMP1516]EOD19837.1 hypothetical protein EMIHUDRAFT_117814 [Emiliania huxleyi CCMP1516]|eukprot:XP_005772266.1 hypothetical protein EMIHUDRAFT_117814 [Emiliania huxleyi CCMP1516]
MLLHPSVLLFFELVDFRPPAGWTRLAWGFLRQKPLAPAPTVEGGGRAASAAPYALRNTPLRVRLFRWQQGVRGPAEGCEVWKQLSAQATARQYSSTLHISLRAAEPPKPLAVQYPFRPMAAHHLEQARHPAAQTAVALTPTRSLEPPAIIPSPTPQGRLTADELRRHAALRYTGSAVSHADDGSGLAALRRFGREPDAPCKVPNTQAHAHHKLIYGLDWGPAAEEDSSAGTPATDGAATVGARLMSVSGDGTAKVWLLTSQDGESAGGLALEATLHHPTFVYSGRFQPHATAATGPARRGGGRREAGGGGGPRAVLLLTGAADGGIRLWDGRTGVLVGSAVGHGSRVNAVVWSADGGGCYSADALGAIKFWEADWRGAGGGGGLKCIQTLKKEGGAAVDSLSLHPSKRRLLVQLRSGALIGLDTRTYHFSTRYVGHSTGEYHVRAGYSPDGRLVFSGDAKGGLHVWVEETGAVLLEGRAIGLLGPLLQVAWSPVEHLVACAAFGPGNALITLAHDSRRENSSG